MDMHSQAADDQRNVEVKRSWQAPRVILGELGDAETQILAGTEIIIYVS